MKSLIVLTLLSFISVTNYANAEAENEVVTDKDFKQHQAKQREEAKKFAKYPAIPQSSDLMASSQKGKKYRMYIDSDGVKKVHEMKKMSLDLLYHNTNRDFKHSGNGTYLLQCNIKGCLKEAYMDSEVYTDAEGSFVEEEVIRMGSFNAVVEVTGEKEKRTSGGKQMVFPVLKILETY